MMIYVIKNIQKENVKVQKKHIKKEEDELERINLEVKREIKTGLFVQDDQSKDKECLLWIIIF